MISLENVVHLLKKSLMKNFIFCAVEQFDSICLDYAYQLVRSVVSHPTWRVSKYGVFSGPYFPPFGLNTQRYFT